MEDFDLEIKREFINEALMNLEEAEGSFMELESASDKKKLLDQIFRLAHNLKGGSRAVGFGDVAEFTHQLENLVLKIQKDEVVLSSEVVTTLLRSNDRLVEMLTQLQGDMSASFNNSDLSQEIQNWLNGQVSVPAPAPALAEEKVEAVAPLVEAVEAPVEGTAEAIPLDAGFAASEVDSSTKLDIPDATAFFAETPSKEVPPPTVPVESSPPAVPQASPEKKPPTNQQSGDSGGGGGGDEVIRVNLSRIDLLNDYVGELIVLQSVIQQQAARTATPALNLSLRQMSKLSKDIQHLSMSLRMLPVKPLVQKLQRVVRDTAQVLNKKVKLNVVGEQLDIDKSVLDRLADPLIHILRNAVDHGLEMPDDREKSGKSQEGTVTLSFSNEGNGLVVEVSDDGKGIDGEVLKKKAIEKNLISASQNLTEKQLINLIFHPGFSTKTVTSEISGRGVGMDVVKTNVEKIGGQIDISTQVGKGSVFRMQIPLSLAVIEGLVVTSENNRYVVPLGQVQETINLSTQKIYVSKTGIGSCFELRGQVVPLVKVERALGLRTDDAIDPSFTALLVNVRDQLIALVIKDIIRAQQIVIKPLGNGIQQQKGWIGSCVLGDGLPTLILSPVDLLDGKVTQKLVQKVAGGSL